MVFAPLRCPKLFRFPFACLWAAPSACFAHLLYYLQSNSLTIPILLVTIYIVLELRGSFMKNEQEFYRCLVSDAASRTLKKILEIIRDDTLSDEICFHKIEAIISLYEELGISTGSRHDFG